MERIVLERRTVNVAGPAADEADDFIAGVLDGGGGTFHREGQSLQGDACSRRRLAGDREIRIGELERREQVDRARNVKDNGPAAKGGGQAEAEAARTVV